MSETTDTGTYLSKMSTFLTKVYAQNVYVGAVLTAMLVAAWIVYLIIKKNQEWKEALAAASQSMKSLAAESVNYETTVEDGDDWQPNT